MTKVVFETATIADSVKKAARIAPSHGAAFDKAAGIVMDINPGQGGATCVLRATNLDVYYMEWVGTTESDGVPVRWRLPSAIMAGILGGLPIGSGKVVSFEGDQSSLTIKSGRTKATLQTIDATYYPHWDVFDVSSIRPVNGFGARLKQVQWAASNGNDAPLTGIHIDGSRLVATDRYKMVTVPCEAESVYRPVTVPAGILAPILKDMSETFIGIDDNMFLLMPDQSTQIKAVIYDAKYPAIDRAMKRDHPASIEFNKNELNDIIGRMLNLVKTDRTPELTVFIGNEEIAFLVADEGKGQMEDAIELPGQAIHDEVVIRFSPKNLQDAVMSAPNDKVTAFYDPENGEAFFRVDGGSGYEAWVAPRVKVESAPATDGGNIANNGAP